MGHAVGRVQHTLAGRHRQIEEKVVVARNKVQSVARPPRFHGIAALAAAQDGRNQLAEQQRGGRRVAVVDLVAHQQSLGHEGFELQPAQTLHGVGQHRAEHVAHPAQTAQHFVVVGPETQYLAQPLVEIAVGAVAAVGVFTTHTGMDGLMTPAIGPTA